MVFNLDLSSQYLENLCDYLYDDLRPRILHEPRLTALCEVCTVLQALMVLDVSAPLSIEDEDEEALDELNLDLNKPSGKRRSLGQLHISHLLQMVLQDAQTRLFFRAQTVIQADIKYYVAKPEDLAYPDKLVGSSRYNMPPPMHISHVLTCDADARKSSSGLDIKEKESISQIFRVRSLDKQDTWFPTLQKTVWVLSQLHNFVKVTVILAYLMLLNYLTSLRSSRTLLKRL